MTETIKTLLEPIQSRLNAATPIELEVAGTEPSMSGQHFSIRRKGIPGLRITGHEYGHGGVYTDLLVHAPTDQARLLAAIQAVDEFIQDAAAQSPRELIPVPAVAGLLRNVVLSALSEAR